MRLTARALACMRGGRTVFEDVSFAVGSGESLCISGRNGAGKSSLLRQIAGLVRIADGTISLDGGDAELSIAEQAHYLGHLDAIKPSLTIVENLRFWACFLSDGEIRLDEALAAVGLAELADLPAAYLSAGQRRRLSIARFLAVARPIWLLDEPTAALDVVAQARLAEVMRGHLAGGGIILAAVHGAIGIDQTHSLQLGEAS